MAKQKFIIEPHFRLHEWVAEEKGYFDDYGVDVTLATKSGTAETTQLLATDQSQAGGSTWGSGFFNSIGLNSGITVVSQLAKVPEATEGKPVSPLIVSKAKFDAGEITTVADLAGKNVFTGPLPFDVRAHLERGLNALGVKFVYKQVDLSTVGSQLESGAIDAMNIYTGSESAPPPWLAEASLATDWAALNPSADELATLQKQGLSSVEVSPKVFHRDVHVDKVIELYRRARR